MSRLRMVLALSFVVVCCSSVLAQEQKSKALRAGMIGLDTSHVIAFTKEINGPNAGNDFGGLRIVAAFPAGTDIQASASRVKGYTEQVKGMGVEIVDSIPALLEKVDVVFLESVDGRPHLEQALPVIKARKPLFIDKPVAASLKDTLQIFDAARQNNVPVFSTSSLRYYEAMQQVRAGKIGNVLGCDTFAPCSLEPTHPDLFWYGIHGVEMLFTCMGAGCESVVRVTSKDTDMVVGRWSDGRIGSFRGLRSGKIEYGGTAFGAKANMSLASSGGYRPMLLEVAKFFQTGKPPVSAEETINLVAFMEAADESKRRGGAPVTIAEVMNKAKASLSSSK